MKEAKGVMAIKYFVWWFAWGIFSAIMILIVIKGGNITCLYQLAIIIGIGVAAGLAGLFCFLKREQA